ncbi:hypothetical protein IV203_022048 [Nitzschia inconspicua]|uniref:Uncharacterized protein n=1 Tax=Nitzschia inconspicua TaxID=303405 RepID=A0A9K3KIV0_9STRA|nr:hypothetical protein IV203_022048 [Nitzschia inconspicua]
MSGRIRPLALFFSAVMGAIPFESFHPPMVLMQQPLSRRCTSYYREKSIFLYEQVNPDSGPSSSASSPSPPLYDGTNYTFPDTNTPTGIAELMEVSFVKACMQLASGYVDVLKMFIAASIAAYENGFSLSTIQNELIKCPIQTANRPLMVEEERLRFNWLCIIYLTLSLMRQPTKGELGVMLDSVPYEVRDDYEEIISNVALAYATEECIPSVEGLLLQHRGTLDYMSAMEKAVISQSLRVAVLTPIVLQDSEAVLVEDDPPKPPIKGAFEQH